jgi:hypothetical protein
LGSPNTPRTHRLGLNPAKPQASSSLFFVNTQKSCHLQARLKGHEPSAGSHLQGIEGPVFTHPIPRRPQKREDFRVPAERCRAVLAILKDNGAIVGFIRGSTSDRPEYSPQRRRDRREESIECSLRPLRLGGKSKLDSLLVLKETPRMTMS